MIEAAQQYLDTARKHERVVWAKQAHVAKGLEKMAYERKIPFDSRVVARGLLDGMYRMSQKLQVLRQLLKGSLIFRSSHLSFMIILGLVINQ